MKLFITWLVFLVSVSSFESSVAGNNNIVIEESNFQQLAKQMQQENRGLVLMLHAEGCTYCEQMDTKILSPMVLSGEYDKRIFIRKLQIDDTRDVIGFSGKTVEPADISGEYNVILTPTLVFLNYKGKEVAEQMVGINTIELFGAYLDNSIDDMMQLLQTQQVEANKKTAQ
ncbi:MAG: hypothetical protein CR955_00580 [Thiotrichales bacterium]|nr:MAG: hypothetical protein CR955_00580 [Thiotrichales bacterium]